jgi:hypothetical protein
MHDEARGRRFGRGLFVARRSVMINARTGMTQWKKQPLGQTVVQTLQSLTGIADLKSPGVGSKEHRS